MKLAHVSDLHLGLSRPNDAVDTRTGLSRTLTDITRCLDAAIDEAYESGAKVLLVSGDAFDNRNPSAAALIAFHNAIERARRSGMWVVIIGGNHDGAMHSGQQAVIELFHNPAAGVWAVTRPEVVDLDGFRIACLPWVSRQQLLSTGVDREGADEAMIDGLCRIIDRFRAEGADVLTGHWSVAGSVLGTERDIAITGERMLTPVDLEGPWSYVAMGHIHKAQPIDITGSASYYAGSIERLNFGEENDIKGFTLVDVELAGKDLGAVDFIETPARQFITLRPGTGVDLLGDRDMEGAIVRCQLEVTEDEARGIDVNGLRAAVLARGAVDVRVQLDIKRSASIRSEAMTTELSELDALDTWIGTESIAEEDATAIRALAKELIAEGGRS